MPESISFQAFPTILAALALAVVAGCAIPYAYTANTGPEMPLARLATVGTGWCNDDGSYPWKDPEFLTTAVDHGPEPHTSFVPCRLVFAPGEHVLTIRLPPGLFDAKFSPPRGHPGFVDLTFQAAAGGRYALRRGEAGSKTDITKAGIYDTSTNQIVSRMTRQFDSVEQ